MADETVMAGMRVIEGWLAAVERLQAENDRLRAEVKQVRSLIALHQQNGCGVQLMREGAQIDGDDDAS